LEGGGLAFEEADVLLADEDVDVAAQAAAVVAQAALQAGMGAVERGEGLVHGQGLDRDGLLAGGVIAQGGGDADGGGPWIPLCWGAGYGHRVPNKGLRPADRAGIGKTRSPAHGRVGRSAVWAWRGPEPPSRAVVLAAAPRYDLPHGRQPRRPGPAHPPRPRAG